MAVRQVTASAKWSGLPKCCEGSEPYSISLFAICLMCGGISRPFCRPHGNQLVLTGDHLLTGSMTVQVIENVETSSEETVVNQSHLSVFPYLANDRSQSIAGFFPGRTLGYP